jgi:general stress protein 26
MDDDMTEETKRIWDLMEKIGICMLVTHVGEKMRGRPMGSIIRRDENAVYFLTDVARHKDDEIRADPRVALLYADTGAQKYVSLTGTAEVSNDRARIEELWTPIAKAWWSGPDDPKIRVLTVTPEDAEYWDSPGTVAAYVSMIAAAVTGGRPDVGKNRKVVM